MQEAARFIESFISVLAVEAENNGLTEVARLLKIASREAGEQDRRGRGRDGGPPARPDALNHGFRGQSAAGSSASQPARAGARLRSTWTRRSPRWR